MSRIILTATLLVATVLTACEGPPIAPVSKDGQYLPKRGGEGLVARAESPIPDVPMPMGFVGVAGESSATVDGGVRRVRHVYQGRGGVGEVMQFYRLQLPWHGWEPADDVVADPAGGTLVYTNGVEKLWIHARKRFMRLTITIAIDGKDAEPLEPEMLSDKSL